MKKVILTAAVCILSLCACENQEFENSNQKSVTFSEIGASMDGQDVKTVLDGLSMCWAEGDAIKVVVDPVLTKPYSLETTEFSIVSGAGTRSAVFRSETEVSGTDIYAAYPAGSSYVKTGEKYIYFDYPSVQHYVENGIEDGIIPMFAYKFTDPSKASFMYGSGIMRLNIYADTDVSVEKIIVTTDTPACGTFVVDPGLKRMPRVKNGSNNQTVLTYEAGGVTLGRSMEHPTQFNICLANTKANGSNVTEDGTYKKITFDIHATDGSVYSVSKENQTIEGGVIYNMPVLKYAGKISYEAGDYYPVPDVDLSDPAAVEEIEGIVFSVDGTGEHGKIFSLTEGSALQWSLGGTVDYTDDKDDGWNNFKTIETLENAVSGQTQYPAFAWAAGLGEGWYIPALNELLAIHSLRGDLSVKKNALNKKLTDVGGTAFSDWFYYSSTEYEIPDGSGNSQRNKVYMVNFKRASTAADLVSGALKKSSDSNSCVYRAVKKF
ncbi:MAG: hypothetical protein ACI3ZQ_11355 [Candidatus Cryptobacteroides sp.]